MNIHNKNFLNIKFSMVLLIRILQAFHSKRLELGQSEVTRYGVCDDFLYSEYLTGNFDDMLQDERLAVMQIIRATINSSSQCYYKLLEEGELQYEDYGIDYDSDEFDEYIEELITKY